LVSMMNCETLQLNLSLYFDDILSSDERSFLDAHFQTCPLCRARLAEIQSLTTDLRMMSKVEMPINLTATIRSKVFYELQNKARKPLLSNSLVEFLQFRIMPYAVGSVASLVLFLGFLGSFPNIQPIDRNDGFATKEIAYINIPKQVKEMEMPNKFGSSETISLTSVDYALSRASFSKESPSINPNGALIAFANTLVRDNVREDEVVLVADVMSNGIAKITQVIEPPKNKLTMEKLEIAMQNDPDFAPFVPSKLDNRSENMQIVFKMQTVVVQQSSTKPKRR
jgi:Putative zinc-finger